MTRREQLVDEIVEAERAILRALFAAAVPTWLQLDLSMAQLKGLFVLQLAGPLTVGGFAEQLGVSLPTASLLAERLVQGGLAARLEDAADRRRTFIELTPQGARLSVQLRQGGSEVLHAWLAEPDDATVEALARGVRPRRQSSRGRRGARAGRAAGVGPEDGKERHAVQADAAPVMGMKAIAIAREYGSGGGEIARRLAARLGWQLLDHDIVAQAAERLGLTAGEADRLDEHGEGFWGRLLVRMEYSVPGGATPQPLINPEDPEQEFQAAVRRLVEQAAATGQVVIVGGCFKIGSRIRLWGMFARRAGRPAPRAPYAARLNTCSTRAFRPRRPAFAAQHTSRLTPTALASRL